MLKGRYEMKKCYNCWFYCHGDGQCYKQMPVIVKKKDAVCADWHKDGLSDKERDDMYEKL